MGVVGDICRALGAKVEPFCDEIVQLLLRNLQNPNLSRHVKPPILSCFGDIALAVEAGFEKYMQVTMEMMVQASQARVPTNNPDMLEYLNQLREGILEAYTGILQGLRAGEKSSAFEPYVMKTLEFLGQLATEMQASPLPSRGPQATTVTLDAPGRDTQLHLTRLVSHHFCCE